MFKICFVASGGQEVELQGAVYEEVDTNLHVSTETMHHSLRSCCDIIHSKAKDDMATKESD